VKYAEKMKAQEIIDDIQNNDFKPRDIDMLLIYLREYSRKFEVFREIANFVAHASRDQGIINDSVERMMSFFQLNIEYIIPKKPLDVSKPIPSWIIKFIQYQINTLDNNTCHDLLGVSKKQVLNRIKKDFSFKNKEATMNKASISEAVARAVQIFSQKPHSPIAPITQDSFMFELIAICNQVGLKVNQVLFTEKSDQLMACILYLTHQTNFGTREGYSCSSAIGVNVPSGGEDAMNEPTLSLQSFISANAPVGVKQHHINISHCLIVTNLRITEWTNGIAPVKESNGNYSSISCRVELNDDFVLIKASA
jgi:hypothetical protein